MGRPAGAVPVVLATVPLTLGTPGVPWIFDLVFVLVVVFTLVQAPTLPWVAQRLGLTSQDHVMDLSVEMTPLDELGADVLEITVGDESHIGGVTVAELRLPVGSNIALVVRGSTSLVPNGQTRLRHGDQLLVIVPAHQRKGTIQRLEAVSREGRLAGWIRPTPRSPGRPE